MDEKDTPPLILRATLPKIMQLDVVAPLQLELVANGGNLLVPNVRNLSVKHTVCGTNWLSAPGPSSFSKSRFVRFMFGNQMAEETTVHSLRKRVWIFTYLRVPRWT